MMRTYKLASPVAKTTVDLRDYSDVIKKAVTSVMQDATVYIEETSYSVDPSPTQGQAIRIGKIICKSSISSNCIHVPKLFTSEEV